jgi:hypothetical protein
MTAISRPVFERYSVQVSTWTPVILRFSWFSSVPKRKCQNNTSIRPRPFPSNLSLHIKWQSVSSNLVSNLLWSINLTRSWIKFTTIHNLSLRLTILFILSLFCRYVEVSVISSYRLDRQAAVRGAYASVDTAVSIFAENKCTRWFKYDRDWFVCKQAEISPCHIWITLYIVIVSEVVI